MTFELPSNEDREHKIVERFSVKTVTSVIEAD